MLEDQQGSAASVAADPTDMTTVFLIMGLLGAGFFLVITRIKPATLAETPPEQAQPGTGQGAPSGANFCSHCGSSRRADQKFCPNCGSAY